MIPDPLNIDRSPDDAYALPADQDPVRELLDVANGIEHRRLMREATARTRVNPNVPPELRNNDAGTCDEYGDFN